MAVFDVRSDVKEEITEIVFAEMEDDYGTSIAHKLTRLQEGLAIKDDTDDEVFVNSVQDAQNLIKALNKAIELGWLK